MKRVFLSLLLATAALAATKPAVFCAEPDISSNMASYQYAESPDALPPASSIVSYQFAESPDALPPTSRIISYHYLEAPGSPDVSLPKSAPVSYASEASVALGLHQVVAPGSGQPIIFDGSLGDMDNRFTLTVDLSRVDELRQNPAEDYVLVVSKRRETSTPDSLPPALWPQNEEFALLSDLLHKPNEWVVHIPRGEQSISFSDSTTTWWQLRGSEWWELPSFGWGIDQWPAAVYDYRVLRVTDRQEVSSSQGTFTLARLTFRTPAARMAQFAAPRPVILLHGFSDTAAFFSLDGDFETPMALSGFLAGSRAVYTLEVPNVASIVGNAHHKGNVDVLAAALQAVTKASDGSTCDVVAHSMGGLIARSYQQRLPAEAALHLGRIVSLGSPFEGTVFGKDAAGAYRNSTFAHVAVVGVKLAQSRGMLAMLTPVGGVESEVARELADPQTNFGLWTNELVENDERFLAVCGTNVGIRLGSAEILLTGAIVGEQAAKLKADDPIAQLRLALLMSRLMDGLAIFADGSDGLATWDSAGKPDLPRPLRKNVYVQSNHLTYNTDTNSDLERMKITIRRFLDGQLLDSDLSPRPVTDPEKVAAWTRQTTIVLKDAAGKLVSYGTIAIRSVADGTTYVISTVSDATGQVKTFLDISLPAGYELVAGAPGYAWTNLFSTGQATRPNTLSSISPRRASVPVSIPSEIILNPDPSYSGPRNTSVQIEGRTPITTNTTVTLAIAAENASEMRVAELGALSAWGPFATSATVSFADTTPGEKWIQVDFRSATGVVGGGVLERIILSPASGAGTLQVDADVAAADVLINGVAVGMTTPATLSNLPPGDYLVSVRKIGTDFTPPLQNVSVASDVTSQVTFQQIVAPLVAAQPLPRTVKLGASTTFTVAASGTPTPTYRWQFSTDGGGSWIDVPDNAPYSGVTNESLSIGQATFAMNRYVYRCMISNNGGTSVSDTALLSVHDNRLVNLSTRGLVGTGDSIMIAGFYISGSGTKPVLIRAVGPTLGVPPYNVPGTISDPIIVVKRQSDNSDFDTSDNWGDQATPQQLIDAMTKTGAFPIPEGSKDSAILLDLPAGGYTAHVSGVAAATGVVIAEVYTVDDSATPNARLVNLSTRGFVSAGDSIMIPGFFNEGNVPRRLLIRGVGPTLAQAPYNVSGVLEDPVLRIFPTGSNSSVAENDDWDVSGSGDEIVGVAAQVSAFTLPRGSKDAVLLFTVPPNSGYTIHVLGKDGASGVAIAEIYEIP